jgi:hypothetical protein
MKILFSAGNYIGSNLMLSRFLHHTSHEIRIATYYRNHQYLHHIDWSLDALLGSSRKYFDKHGFTGPKVNSYNVDLFIDDLLQWQPDLVINDCEIITALITKILDIPLWYCSPLLQLTGIIHNNGFNLYEFSKTIFDINQLPKGDLYLVYSPLCDIASRPLLKTGYEWIKPYYQSPKEITTENINFEKMQYLFKDVVINTGETSILSDHFYSGKSVLISPNPGELEQLLNARLFNWYGAGLDIGRSFDINFLNMQVERVIPKSILSIQNWSQLHERI